MFCTGGIRCEKSTSLLLQEGFNEVYHLKGGILKYLEETPADESMWEGECFVFDGRTAVTHGMQEGENIKCHACGLPLIPEEAALPSYEHGVSCKYCIDKTTEQQKKVSVCANLKLLRQSANAFNSTDPIKSRSSSTTAFYCNTHCMLNIGFKINKTKNFSKVFSHSIKTF